MATTPLTIAMSRSTPCRGFAGVRRVGVGLAPLLLLYAFYTAIRFVVAGRGPVVGERHAGWILDLERALSLDWELGLQRATLDHTWLISAANHYYVYGFLPVLVTCAVLGAWRATRAFAWWRTAFAVSLALALIGYVAFPLAPPRLLPAAEGFVDTLQLYGPRYYGDATGSSLFNAYGSIPSLVNEYAAMPSMHVAWSIVAGALLFAAFRRRWALAVAIIHPLLMAISVVITGNHYLLDVVGGIAVLLAAIALTPWLGRRGELSAKLPA
ncbi:MAG: phosphatase PAP2 family protein [Thermomicrobiales bacterium]